MHSAPISAPSHPHSEPSGVEIIRLPWQPDAIQHYAAKLSHQPWTMVLHSGFAAHAYSRFDILVADPLLTLQTRHGVTEICQQQQRRTLSGDPLSLLQQCLSQYFPPLTPCEDLPFIGGAVGLFGYDLARYFEKLPQHASADLSTADMAVGLYPWALIADQQQQQLSLVCLPVAQQMANQLLAASSSVAPSLTASPATVSPSTVSPSTVSPSTTVSSTTASSTTAPLTAPPLTAQQRLDWLNAQSAPAAAPFRLTSRWCSNMSRQQYGEKFRQIQRYLLAGDCYQVNLAQRFHATYQGDEWQAFHQLNAACRAPFSAFLRLPQQAILSLSPERFLLLHQRQIQTRPIKGTLPRLTVPQEDAQQAQRLATSAKDRAENLMIVDLMRNDIGRVASPGSVQVPQLFAVEQFPAVHHLVSTISGQLADGLSACDLLRACFPGGSITGAPKIRAMEIIEQLEPVRRNGWCGSIGYVSCCGNMDTSISIRTLIAENGQLYCSAGGGIVIDSDEQAEYDETLSKVQAILAVLSSIRS